MARLGIDEVVILLRLLWMIKLMNRTLGDMRLGGLRKKWGLLWKRRGGP